MWIDRLSDKMIQLPRSLKAIYINVLPPQAQKQDCAKIDFLENDLHAS